MAHYDSTTMLNEAFKSYQENEENNIILPEMTATTKVYNTQNEKIMGFEKRQRGKLTQEEIERFFQQKRDKANHQNNDWNKTTYDIHDKLTKTIEEKERMITLLKEEIVREKNKNKQYSEFNGALPKIKDLIERQEEKIKELIDENQRLRSENQKFRMKANVLDKPKEQVSKIWNSIVKWFNE